MSINRNPDSLKVEAYFGTPEWRDYWNGGRLSRTSGLVRFYLDRFLGGFGLDDEQPDYARLVRDDGNRFVYYLLFASKVGIGKRIMDSVFGQPNSSGQMQFKLPYAGD